MDLILGDDGEEGMLSKAEKVSQRRRSDKAEEAEEEEEEEEELSWYRELNTQTTARNALVQMYFSQANNTSISYRLHLSPQQRSWGDVAKGRRFERSLFI